MYCKYPKHMRMRRLAIYAAAALALLVSGCSQSNKPTSKQVVTKQWNNARANVLAEMAKEQFQSGDLEKCRATIREALKLEPQNASVHLLSAKLAIEQGQLEQADISLNLARQYNPADAEADYLTGVVYQRWQKPATACEHYRRAGEKNPTELAYVLALAETMVSMEQSAEALSLLQSKIVTFEHSFAIRDAIGLLLMQKGKYGDAAQMLRQASILAGEETAVREHLAMALYHAGEYRECADVLGRLLKDERYASRTDLMLLQGESQMQTGRLREARDTLEAASQLAPGDCTVWLSLAKAAMQLNDIRRVELSLKKAMALDPSNGQAHLLCGYLRVRQGRMEEALAEFRQANSLDGTDTVSLCMVGYVLEKMGRGEEAMRVYAQALKIKPGDELASRLMAGVDVHE